MTDVPDRLAGHQAHVVVHPVVDALRPFRRVEVMGVQVGKAYGVLDVIEFARRAGLDDIVLDDTESVLGACNAPLAHRALAVDRRIGLLLPCNVVVRTAEGRTVMEAIDPQIMVQVTERPALAAVAGEATTRAQGPGPLWETGCRSSGTRWVTAIAWAACWRCSVRTGGRPTWWSSRTATRARCSLVRTASSNRTPGTSRSAAHRSCFPIASQVGRRLLQVLGEPVGGQLRDGFEGTGFLEQVGGAGDDGELALARELRLGLAVEVEHEVVATSDN